MKLGFIILVSLFIGVLLGMVVFVYVKTPIHYTTTAYLDTIQDFDIKDLMQAGPGRPVHFSETFDTPFTLEENWPIQKSGNPNWWVSSGAYLISENGIGRTISGDLDPIDPWVARFMAANARDTSNGLRPQNIFRLVLKKKFRNATQELYARMTYYDQSESAYRDASNGILLFNHYQDENSLYYTGIRVDGLAVTKKKLNGVYTTLATKKVFDGSYDRKTNPNLIPLNTWIGLRTEIYTDATGGVNIKLYTDIGKTGTWTLALETTDKGRVNGKAIPSAGYGGIRTDFMDVQFDDFVLNVAK